MGWDRLPSPHPIWSLPTTRAAGHRMSRKHLQIQVQTAAPTREILSGDSASSDRGRRDRSNLHVFPDIFFEIQRTDGVQQRDLWNMSRHPIGRDGEGIIRQWVVIPTRAPKTACTFYP